MNRFACLLRAGTALLSDSYATIDSLLPVLVYHNSRKRVQNSNKILHEFWNSSQNFTFRLSTITPLFSIFFPDRSLIFAILCYLLYASILLSLHLVVLFFFDFFYHFFPRLRPDSLSSITPAHALSVCAIPPRFFPLIHLSSAPNSCPSLASHLVLLHDKLPAFSPLPVISAQHRFHAVSSHCPAAFLLAHSLGLPRRPPAFLTDCALLHGKWPAFSLSRFSSHRSLLHFPVIDLTSPASVFPPFPAFYFL